MGIKTEDTFLPGRRNARPKPLLSANVRPTRLARAGLDYNLIPPEDAYITSLARATDCNIYGGTSGGTACLFRIGVGSNATEALGCFPGHAGIRNSLALAPKGAVLIGTGGVVSSKENPYEDYEGYEGGHLYLFDPAQVRRETVWLFPAHSNIPRPLERGEPCQALDLGIPVPGEGIYALTSSPDLSVAYGVTFPGGILFSYDMKENAFQNHGPVCRSTAASTYVFGKTRLLTSIPRALSCDSEGNLYGNGDNAELFRLVRGEEAIEMLGVHLPCQAGREFRTVIDAFVRRDDGRIFGGTSDGYIFEFVPETIEVRGFGKPIRPYRTRALTFGRDGVVYGVGGEPQGMVRLFSFDPDTHEHYDYGFFGVRQAEAMCTADDGTIYIGESERRGGIVIFYPY